jgi:hypothetical protein
MGIVTPSIKKWIESNFKETWKEVVETDIDFSTLEPFKTSTSLHIYEEKYEVKGETYRLLYPIGYEKAVPLIELLITD